MDSAQLAVAHQLAQQLAQQLSQQAQRSGSERAAKIRKLFDATIVENERVLGDKVEKAQQDLKDAKEQVQAVGAEKANLRAAFQRLQQEEETLQELVLSVQRKQAELKLHKHLLEEVLEDTACMEKDSLDAERTAIAVLTTATEIKAALSAEPTSSTSDSPAAAGIASNAPPAHVVDEGNALPTDEDVHGTPAEGLPRATAQFEPGALAHSRAVTSFTVRHAMH